MCKTKNKARRKGAGTLEKRPDGIWRARWTVSGKTFTRTTGTTDKREAEKRLAEIVAPFNLKSEAATLEGLAVKIAGVKAEIKRHEDAKPALALADLWEAYRTSPKRPDCGNSTLGVYRAKVERLVEWTAKHHPEAVEVRDFTDEDAAEFFTDLKAELQPETYNAYLMTMRLVWRVVKKEARWTADPFEEIKRRLALPHRRRELTLEELRRVAAAVSGEMRTLFATGIYTGLRLGDCALLKWENIDAGRGLISVIPMKTARHSQGKRLEIPIHPALAAILAETPPERRRGLVNPKLAALYRKGRGGLLSMEVQKVFAACGIETGETIEGRKSKAVTVSFHSLRHTFVSMCANAGTPLSVVQAIAGHSDPKMTEHYFHESLDATRRAVATLPNVLAIGDGGTATDAGGGESAIIEGEATVRDTDAPAKAAQSRAGAGKATDTPATATDAPQGAESATLAAFRAAALALPVEERAAALAILQALQK